MAWMIKAGNGAWAGMPSLVIESSKQSGACGWRLVSTPRHDANGHPAPAVADVWQVWENALAQLTA